MSIIINNKMEIKIDNCVFNNNSLDELIKLLNDDDDNIVYSIFSKFTHDQIITLAKCGIINVISVKYTKGFYFDKFCQNYYMMIRKYKLDIIFNNQ